MVIWLDWGARLMKEWVETQKSVLAIFTSTPKFDKVMFLKSIVQESNLRQKQER